MTHAFPDRTLTYFFDEYLLGLYLQDAIIADRITNTDGLPCAGGGILDNRRRAERVISCECGNQLKVHSRLRLFIQHYAERGEQVIVDDGVVEVAVFRRHPQWGSAVCCVCVSVCVSLTANTSNIRKMLIVFI